MPRVPTYDNFQVSMENLPNAQIRPAGARFDAPWSQEQATLPGRTMQQFGQAMTQAGTGLAKMVADELEVANTVRVNDAMNKAAKARLELTFNPDYGFVNIKGENALKRPNDQSLDQEYGEKFQAQIDEIGKNLGNDAQRIKFKAQSDQLVQQFQGSLSQHIAKEYNTYQDSVDEGVIRTGREQMALAWSDSAAINQARESLKAAVYTKGTRAGLSAKAIEAAQVEALSPGHVAVISAAVDAGNIDYAKEYLKQHNAELSLEHRLRVTKAVETGADEERAQTAAGDLWVKHGGDIGAALAEAREKFKGKDEDNIVTRLKTLDTEKKGLETRARAEAQDAAWSIYNNTGSLAKIPATVKAAMDPQDWAALKNHAKAAADGADIKTDLSVYYALTVAASTDPNFAKEDLRKYADKLSKADFKHFVDIQGKVIKPDEAADMATVTQQKDAIVKSLGLKGEAAGQFHMTADRALLAEQARLGRKPSQVERQKVLDRLVLEGTTPGAIWGTNNTRAWQAAAQGKPFTPVWSDVQKRQATQALQRQGIKNPTTQQVEAVLQATYSTQ